MFVLHFTGLSKILSSAVFLISKLGPTFELLKQVKKQTLISDKTQEKFLNEKIVCMYILPVYPPGTINRKI